MRKISEAPGVAARGGQRWDSDGRGRPAHSSGTPIRAASGRVIGEVIGDTFRKRVREDTHMLKVPPGWASDVCSLEQAERAGARHVELEATDTGRTWTAPLSLFWSKAVPVSRGFGEQLALPLCFWTISEPGEPAARQLEMFAEVPA